jgi:hypothetical protein
MTTDDRAEMKAARSAGKAIHQAQRLGRARPAHYNEAVKAAAVAIGRAFNGDPLTWRAEAEAAVEAVLPHLRAYQIEVQTRIGYALGRKETAAEIAQAIETHPFSGSYTPFRIAAAIAREIGTKEAERPAHPGMHPLEATCNEACWNKRDHP